jgi:hypothetical protein
VARRAEAWVCAAMQDLFLFTGDRDQVDGHQAYRLWLRKM